MVRAQSPVAGRDHGGVRRGRGGPQPTPRGHRAAVPDRARRVCGGDSRGPAYPVDRRTLLRRRRRCRRSLSRLGRRRGQDERGRGRERRRADGRDRRSPARAASRRGAGRPRRTVRTRPLARARPPGPGGQPAGRGGARRHRSHRAGRAECPVGPRRCAHRQPSRPQRPQRPVHRGRPGADRGHLEPDDPEALAIWLGGLIWWTEQNLHRALDRVGEDQDQLAAGLVRAVMAGPETVAIRRAFLSDALTRA